MRKKLPGIYALALVVLLLAGRMPAARAADPGSFAAEGVSIDLGGVPEGVLTFVTEGAFLLRVGKDGEDDR